MRILKSRPTGTASAKGNPWAESCPSRALMGILASKWVLLLMPLLGAGPKRNSELMRAVQGISQKMLTQTLSELEERRLVVRRDFGEVPPRVEYELTALGRSLARVINVLDQWVVDNYHQTR